MNQQFASDNYSGICPEVLNYLSVVNTGHEPAYGEDRWTSEACELFREMFQLPCEVYFVSTGTAGNSLSLASLCKSYHSVICHNLSHVETDECGAPEFFSHGSKLLLTDGTSPKIEPEDIERLVLKRTDIHYPKPRVVSLTQASELGRVYQHSELQAISNMVKKHKLKFHMDGTRLANAVCHLGVDLPTVTAGVGVDVLVFGGTKNGIGFGEAVVFFDLAAAEEFDYRCKQAGQLTSKMRFIAAQWLGLLKRDTWLSNARIANERASLLASELENVDEAEILYPPEANSVFLRLPEMAVSSMHEKGWKFYTFIGNGGVRLMCSWDTSEESIKNFVSDLKACLSR
ncbi:MAG: low specificity L-threonine aldolase [Verrucomicrobiota bacterium]